MGSLNELVDEGRVSKGKGKGKGVRQPWQKIKKPAAAAHFYNI